MTAARRNPLKRIAVALHGSAADRNHLETATHLAEQHTAEVTGVFIEDTDLLRAADLPYAMEWCRTTNVVRRVRSADLKRQLAQRAAAAEQSLAQCAARRGVKWTFTRVRKQVHVAILETARGVDVTMISRSQKLDPYRQSVQPASEAPEATRGTVVVVFDRGGAAQRGLEFGDRYARLRGMSLCVLAVGRTRPGIDKLSEQISQLERRQEVKTHTLYRPEFSHVIAVARGENPSMLVVPIGWLDVAPERIEETLESLHCPVFIVK